METLESLKEQRKKLDEKIKALESKQVIVFDNVRLRADKEFLDIHFRGQWRTIAHTRYDDETTFKDCIKKLIGNLENALKQLEENEA